MVEYAPGYPHNRAILTNQKGMTYRCMPQPEETLRILFSMKMSISKGYAIYWHQKTSLKKKDQPRNNKPIEQENGLIIVRDQGWSWGRMERVRPICRMREGEVLLCWQIFWVLISGVVSQIHTYEKAAQSHTQNHNGHSFRLKRNPSVDCLSFMAEQPGSFLSTKRNEEKWVRSAV